MTDSNNRKQENPIIFKVKSIGDNSLKKLDIDTIRNPIVTINEIIFVLFILNNSPFYLLKQIKATLKIRKISLH
ncbi:hypothetical protein NX86_01005 [Streptococcus phocae subsp. salmonis]|nr:hypothetical protein NX86_01005 [Streptococcus phocae subsp. salmonis]